MKRKPIKIDWEAVDEAFNNLNEELVYYLDLVTGQVGLEGEGEEDEFDPEDEDYDPTAVTPPAAPPRNDTTRLYVVPPDTPQKIEWMGAFLEEDPNVPPDLAEQIRQAFDAEDAAHEIGEILRESPDVRDRWFLYRTDRLHELIDRWLEENSVEMIEPPPWR